MVRTNSTMLPLETTLPPFDLEVVAGSNLRLNSGLMGLKRITHQSLLSKPVLLMVLCAHCPFVKHIEQGLSSLDQDYGETVQLIAVASNSLITHPEDGPEHLASQLLHNGWRFPYLLDSDQDLAKALKAACTPDFFLFAPNGDGQQHLKYRGQLDESRPGNDIAVSGKELRAALNAVINGQTVSSEQVPSIGCNIKWHPGKEPSWFG